MTAIAAGLALVVLLAAVVPAAHSVLNKVYAETHREEIASAMRGEGAALQDPFAFLLRALTYSPSVVASTNMTAMESIIAGSEGRTGCTSCEGSTDSSQSYARLWAGLRRLGSASALCAILGLLVFWRREASV